jgi:hypothetical protein
VVLFCAATNRFYSGAGFGLSSEELNMSDTSPRDQSALTWNAKKRPARRSPAREFGG